MTDTGTAAATVRSYRWYAAASSATRPARSSERRFRP
jgi:hypothetical protein